MSSCIATCRNLPVKGTVDYFGPTTNYQKELKALSLFCYSWNK